MYSWPLFWGHCKPYPMVSCSGPNSSAASWQPASCITNIGLFPCSLCFRAKPISACPRSLAISPTGDYTVSLGIWRPKLLLKRWNYTVWRCGGVNALSGNICQWKKEKVELRKEIPLPIVNWNLLIFTAHMENFSIPRRYAFQPNALCLLEISHEVIFTVSHFYVILFLFFLALSSLGFICKIKHLLLHQKTPSKVTGASTYVTSESKQNKFSTKHIWIIHGSNKK